MIFSFTIKICATHQKDMILMGNIVIQKNHTPTLKTVFPSAMISMEGTMNKNLKRTMFWTPRIAGILFVLFLSLFALDILDMQLGFWGTIVGLFIHLIPSILLAIAIALAWRWEWVGALIFAGWSVFYMVTARGFHWSVYVIIAGIPFVIGVLFLLDWIYNKEIRPV